MNSSRRSRTTSASRGFTLLEIMVSLTVLALMAGLVTQVLGGISSTWQNGMRHINNFTKARAMLDLVAQDIQSGVFRSDLAVFPGSTVTLYTQRQGVGGIRNLTLVNYAINASDAQSPLQRGDLSVNWVSTISFGSTNDFGSNVPVARDTAAGVLGFELIFVQEDGTYSRTYSTDATNPTRAVAVALAVVDDQTLRLLVGSNKTARLRAELKGAVTGKRSVRADWEDYLHTGLNWSSYPGSLATGFQVFERYVPLPVSH